jgi:hypothetical protein
MNEHATMKQYKVIYENRMGFVPTVEVIVQARNKEKARWYANMGREWGKRKPLEVIEL